MVHILLKFLIERRLKFSFTKSVVSIIENGYSDVKRKKYTILNPGQIEVYEDDKRKTQEFSLVYWPKNKEDMYLVRVYNKYTPYIAEAFFCLFQTYYYGMQQVQKTIK